MKKERAQQFHLHAQVTSAIPSLLRTSAAAESAETTESSSATSEDVTEHAEYIIHAHAGSSTESTGSTELRTVESILVILLTLLRVTQHVISLGCFLELLFGGLLFLVRLAYLAVGAIFL